MTDVQIRPPSVSTHIWALSSSQYSGGPSCGCYSLSFGCQPANPEPVHPEIDTAHLLGLHAPPTVPGCIVNKFGDKNSKTKKQTHWIRFWSPNQVWSATTLLERIMLQQKQVKSKPPDPFLLMNFFIIRLISNLKQFLPASPVTLDLVSQALEN